MYRLGIWINVNVYLFMWINSKSSIKHLVVLLYHSKQICFLMWVQMSESFHNLNYIYPFKLCIQNLCCKAFEPIFTKELVFDLDVKHVFHGVKFVRIQTSR